MTLWVLLAACGGAADPPVESCDTCVLSQENNYSYQASLDVQLYRLAQATDAELDWSALTLNMRGVAIDPVADVDEVWLVVFQDLEPDELDWQLANDAVKQEDATLIVTCEPTGEASCWLSEFTFFGNPLNVQQYFEEDRGTWLLVLGSATDSSAQAVAFLQARPDSQETLALITDDTSVLQMDVDLVSLSPVPLVGSDASVSWSGLDTDGMGNSLSLYTLDELMVARYDERPAELAASFGLVDQIYEERWQMPIEGITQASLGDLQGSTEFPGPDDHGTWLLGLLCSTCTNPAPRFLTILEAP